MDTNQIIAYVDGVLSESEKKVVEQFLLHNPSFLTVVGSMNRIRMNLTDNESLSGFFQKKSEEVKAQMRLKTNK
jgi:anti-sigma factor RsiW